MQIHNRNKIQSFYTVSVRCARSGDDGVVAPLFALDDAVQLPALAELPFCYTEAIQCCGSIPVPASADLFIRHQNVVERHPAQLTDALVIPKKNNFGSQQAFAIETFDLPEIAVSRQRRRIKEREQPAYKSQEVKVRPKPLLSRVAVPCSPALPPNRKRS